MDNWRIKGDKCNQGLARTYNYHRRKPPLGGYQTWQQKIPYWEKRFVASVGSFSWKKFLETKEFTHLYDNILNWNDSAAKETFKIAKNQFYAKFHDLPYNINLHDPDLYIDKIDWNAQVDYNLLHDLESEPAGQDDADPHDPVVIFGDVLPDPYKNCSPYGWGDSDDVKRDQNEINWDDYIDKGRIIWDDCGVWNGNDNKAGFNQGWNTNAYDENNNLASYGNVNNERCKTWAFNANNGHGSRFWRNNGNRKKSTGQTYVNRRRHGSTFRSHGSQRVHVHQ